MTLDGTRTYIVGELLPVVIDPGPEDPPHLAALVELLAGSASVAILLTHAHADHAGCAPALAHALGLPVRAALDAHVETDAGTIEAVPTPGHTRDHLAFRWTGGSAPAGGAIFVGDLMMGAGDTTLVAPPEGDVGDYLRSLERVAELEPAVLYPAHGPPLTDPAEAIERYRAHRLARVAQLREALAREPGASAERLVEVIYGAGLDPSLREAAAGSVRAMVTAIMNDEL